MPSNPTCKNILASVLFAGLAACSSGEEVGVIKQSLAGTSVGHLPSVTRFIAAGDGTQRTAFIAGNLGAQLAPVLEGFGMSHSELHRIDSKEDALGIVVERYEQLRNHLRVVNGDLRITRNASGEILSATGTSWDEKTPLIEPTLSVQRANQIAIEQTVGANVASQGELVYIAPSSGSAPVLAWQYAVSGEHEGMPVLDEVFVDAATGEVVDRHPQIHNVRNRNTYNANGLEDYGDLVRNENSANSGNQDVDLAHAAAGVTYDCLQNVFGRDSFDGNGAEMASIANFGQNFQNAFWSSEDNVMVYGAGFAVQDVGTHEVGHALTTYTANMVYQNEPGALNEAWSDILSAVCDANQKGSVSSATWSLGEEMQGGAFRFMDNPAQDGFSSDFYPTRVITEEDQGGVHYNSGIANLAFYMLSQGGTHPRAATSVQVEGVGIEIAGAVFYRALTTYMNVNSDFAAARAATEQAADDLYGAGSANSISVSEAWSAVGVGGPAPVRPEPEPEPEEPGDGETGPGNGPDGQGFDDPGDIVGGCSTSGSSAPLLPSFLLMLGALVVGRRRKSKS